MSKNQFKLFGRQLIRLEYPVAMAPRWGYGRPPHSGLHTLIAHGVGGYSALLHSFEAYCPAFTDIKKAKDEKDLFRPAWNNGFLPGLDMVALYGMLARLAPARYVEVGSGNSTKMARKAINDLGLPTRIVSIDPFPRADIDALADEVVRMPFEELGDYSALLDLSENDILFIDNSHRAFPNSDVTVFFMEILPMLNKGVVVQLHDIYLPFDYPDFMCDRAYSEQYLLATAIMANPDRYYTLLPNYFVSQTPELHNVLAPLWARPELSGVETHGGSYWLRIQTPPML